PTAVAEFLVDQLLAFEFHLSAQHEKLAGTVKRIVQNQVARLERYAGDLHHLSRGMLERRSEQLAQLSQILRRATENSLTRKKDHLVLLEKQTELVNPDNILKRGFSITMLHGRAISGIQDAKPGDLLKTRLHRGEITSKVEKTSK
ncbi:MAG: hypothetical protein KAT15_01670, partial [Bacteroidales bacterium]|nr:hypothetical protein [Bacteroidales bacterium]